jgi:hypothetical protein
MKRRSFLKITGAALVAPFLSKMGLLASEAPQKQAAAPYTVPLPEVPWSSCNQEFIDSFYRELKRFPFNRAAQTIKGIELEKDPYYFGDILKGVSVIGNKGKHFAVMIEDPVSLLNNRSGMHAFVADVLSQITTAWRRS